MEFLQRARSRGIESGVALESGSLLSGDIFGPSHGLRLYATGSQTELMTDRRHAHDHLARLERAATIVLGLYLTGTALDALGHGRWLFADYLGLEVPAPLGLGAGLLVLGAGTIWWRKSWLKH